MSRPRYEPRFVSPESMAEERQRIIEAHNIMMYGIVLLIVGVGAALATACWVF